MNHAIPRFLLAAVAMFALGSIGVGADAPEKLKLWNGNAPIGDGKFDASDAFITVHKPEKPNGTAVVICPEGGNDRPATVPWKSARSNCPRKWSGTPSAASG